MQVFSEIYLKNTWELLMWINIMLVKIDSNGLYSAKLIWASSSTLNVQEAIA